MASPGQLESLRECLVRSILDDLTNVLLQYPSLDCLSNPVLRFEAFVEDGYCSLSPSTSREPVLSVSWYFLRDHVFS